MVTLLGESRVGTYADVVVADAIVNDITGFSIPTAIEALKKDSFEEPPRLTKGAVGKEGLNEYNEIGFVSSSSTSSESVSRSLDYAHADYAISQALEKLVKDNKYDISLSSNLKLDANKLKIRSEKVLKSLYDNKQHLMLPHNRDGEVAYFQDSKTWGNGYTEGNAWHHSFPPWAIQQLKVLYGSKEKLLEKLHKMFEIPSTFLEGSYGQEIHEMTEMRALAMGQYGHNNQPCHHIIYMFALLGDRASTENLVRYVLDHAYGIDFYAGDEDNGEQGAWFVLSAIGLYSAAPGSSKFVFGSPLFRFVSISRRHIQKTFLSGFTLFIEPVVVSKNKNNLNQKHDNNNNKHNNNSDTITSNTDNNISNNNNNNTTGSSSNNNKDGSSSLITNLDIFALGTSPYVTRVSSIMFNFNKIDTPEINFKLLLQGGILRFLMKDEKDDVMLTTEQLYEYTASRSKLENVVKKQSDVIVELKRNMKIQEEEFHRMKIQNEDMKIQKGTKNNKKRKLSKNESFFEEIEEEIESEIESITHFASSTPSWRVHSTGFTVLIFI
eukprot:gene9664-20093_t